MHISEGVLSVPVLLTGGVGTILGLTVGLRHMQARELPKTALLTSTFFMASLVHIPIGPSSSHLVLNGILGILLGWAAFPAIFIGLFLQAVLFQFGGLTSLGVNTLNMAVPAVILGMLARPVLRRTSGLLVTAISAVSGSGAIMLSAVMVAGSLAFSGDSFVTAGKMVFLAHIPIAIAEGVISVLIVSFLLKTKPEMIRGSMDKSTNSKTNSQVVTMIAISILLAVANQADAHRVNLFAWCDGDMIQAEGYFSGGKKAVNSTVLIYDFHGTEIFQGKTDKQGKFSYKPPGDGEYRLVLEASMGHRAETVVHVEGIGSASSVAPESGQTPLEINNGPELQRIEEASQNRHDRAVVPLSVELEQILDRKLNPIREQLMRLAEQGDKVSFRDVVAGLGYIVGIMGLVMYMAQRKNKR